MKPEFEKKYKFSSNSDSEIVGMLYKEVYNIYNFKYGPADFWNHMEGMHATILLDMNNK